MQAPARRTGSPRRPVVTSVAALVIAVGLLTEAVPAQAQDCPAEAWPTTAFEVRTYRDVTTWTNAARRTPELWEAFFENLIPDEPTPEEAAQITRIEQALQEIAEAYKAAGFGCPHMETAGSGNTLRYVAYFIDFATDPVIGAQYREPERQAQQEERLTKLGITYGHLDPPHFVITRTHPGLESQTTDLYQTLAHELMHVIQHTYDRQFGSVDMDAELTGRDFVVEGTADGVARYIANQRFPGIENARETAQQTLGGYEYTNSMVRAKKDGDSMNAYGTGSFMSAYATSSFWLHLIEQHGGLSVIERLLRRRVGEGATEEDRIRWLDAGLRADPAVGRGLGVVFPQFLAEMASYGWTRYQAITADSWLDWTLELCRDPVATRILEESTIEAAAQDLTPFASHVMARREWLANPLDSACTVVDWSAFPDQLRPTLLEVEITGPDPAHLDQIQVGLAAQGTKYCWPARESCVINDFVSFRVDDRNYKVWHIGVDDFSDPSALIVLTNIARRNPWTTTSAENLDVRVRLLWEEASMAPRSSAAGSVDDAMPIDLDIMTGQVVPTPSARATLPNECHVTFLGRNSQTQDAVLFAMVHEGPIRPGVYAISASDEPEHLEASEAPGTFTGDFAIGRGNPMSGGRGMGFWFLSGEVEITSIAGRLVSGEVRANAWRNRYHEIGVGYVDDPFGPELTSVVARFTFLANGALASRLGIPMARRCLAEEPAPGGGPPPRSDPPPPSGGDPPRPPGRPPIVTVPPDVQVPPGRDIRLGPPPPPPGAPPTEPPPAAPPADPPAGNVSGNPPGERGGAAKTLDTQGFINRFTLRATGGLEATREGGALNLSGGCTGSAPMSISFRSGLPTAEDYLYVGFETEDVIGPGRTGTFAVKEIRWDHGTISSQSRPGARVPNRFSGGGRLTLTTHEAAVGQQRMVGTLTGEGLTNREGVSANLVVEFDINRSCGLS